MKQTSGLFRTKGVIFFLLVYSCLYAHQECNYVFRGKMNKERIVFQINGHNDIWNASYFFTGSLQKTNLVGKSLDEKVLVFTSNSDSIWVNLYARKPQVKWFKEGKKVKLQLSFKGEYQTNNPFPFTDRTNYLTFSMVSQDDLVSVWEESNSGIPFIRLGQGSSLDSTLRQIHQNLALQSIDCGYDTSCFNSHYKVLTSNDQYLSFSLCTVKKVNQFNTVRKTNYYNYNVNNAKVLRLEDFVFFGEGDIPSYQSQDWFSYRYEIFPSYFLHFLNVEDTCLDDLKYWQFPTWFLSGDNLMVSPYASIKNKNCNYNTWKKIHLKDLNNN